LAHRVLSPPGRSGLAYRVPTFPSNYFCGAVDEKSLVERESPDEPLAQYRELRDEFRACPCRCQRKTPHCNGEVLGDEAGGGFLDERSHDFAQKAQDALDLAKLMVTEAQAHVVVVEDSQVIRDGLVRRIGSLGTFEVVGVAAAEPDAAALVTTKCADIVFTDLKLAEGSGIEVIREGRDDSNCQRPHIFNLTNYAHPRYDRRCHVAGTDGLFDKSLAQFAQGSRRIGVNDPE